MTGSRSPNPTSRWGVIPSPEAASFEAALRPHLTDLAAAAREEVERLVALGALEQREISPQELLERSLLLAWRRIARRPFALSVRAWVFVILFRTADSIERVRLGRRDLTTLGEPDDDQGRFEDEDEAFWQWFQPARGMRRTRGWRTVLGLVGRSAFDDMIRSLDPSVAQVFVMVELFRVPLRGVAAALGIDEFEAERLLTAARRGMRSELANLQERTVEGPQTAVHDKPACNDLPPAGPHDRPSLINPDATPGTGALPSCGVGDEADPATE